MKAKHKQDRLEDYMMLCKGTCPWTKQPCGAMKDGLVIVKPQITLDDFK
jgi:hypothetical protein